MIDLEGHHRVRKTEHGQRVNPAATMPMLPIDAQLFDIVQTLKESGALVLEAPPGTGKTTRVPLAVARELGGLVICLEPRRIAARAAAGFVAGELGEVVGKTVGFAIRMERKSGPETQVLYMTEALLTRRMAQDPALSGVSCVILDEFHERSVHADLALAWVKKIRATVRPDLKLVVMSATLDGERLMTYLGCPRIQVQSTYFPVEVIFAPWRDERYLDVQVVAAVRAELGKVEGDILVFLPGVGEIGRCLDALSSALVDHPDVEVLPLHGELSSEQQDRALTKSKKTRVILSTNVAETSVTVDGVRGVIDTGTARIAGFDPWTGISTLDLQPIGRASAIQRAGRAGRQGPGRCLRLYTRGDFEGRPYGQEPELRRTDLGPVVLELAPFGELSWLDAPDGGAWAAATQLLERLGALDRGRRTRIGDIMVRLPVAPRVARMLVEASALGVGRAGACVAVLFEGRGRREVVDLVELALGWAENPEQARWLLPRQRQELRQILALLPESQVYSKNPELDLKKAIFIGFFDRIGKRKAGTMLLSGGGAAVLDPTTPGGDGFYLVTGVEKVGQQTKVSSASPFPGEWLLDYVEVRAEPRWVENRVEVREQWLYGAVVVEESPGQGDPAEVARVLLENIRPSAHRIFSDYEEADLLIRRVKYLVRCGFSVPLLELNDVLSQAVTGCYAIHELKNMSLMAIASEQLRGFLIDHHAPARLQLGRWRAPIEYPEDGDPYISSRLQDFFGLAAGPQIANGRPLLLHLLAPNQRPVQVTTDLAGFWVRHYPALRKELMRKYPRHAWPENPLDPASIAAAQPVPRRH